MRLKYTFDSTGLTKKGLLVRFAIRTGSVERIKTVLVPWSELTDRECLDIIHERAAASLSARWAEVEKLTQDELPWD
uniref:Uncharacterized protein n=1 Tax=uncultured prokaryote TaxID=198431 RepID=A0A0H5Q686_9ZZZZ|nr:hypothetical protein [uncultured prokaryote]